MERSGMRNHLKTMLCMSAFLLSPLFLFFMRRMVVIPKGAKRNEESPKNKALLVGTFNVAAFPFFLCGEWLSFRMERSGMRNLVENNALFAFTFIVAAFPFFMRRMVVRDSSLRSE